MRHFANRRRELQMPSYFSNELFLQIRKRKKLTQAELLSREIVDRDPISKASIERIEKNKHTPRMKSVKALAEALDLPVDTLLIPYFENQTSHILQLRDKLQFYLLYATNYSTAYQRVVEIIDELERDGNFAIGGGNRQYLLCCKATLREISGADPRATMRLINEGMAITFPEYNEATFDGDALIFHEVNLLLTKAKVYKRNGQLLDAIALLIRISKGLENLPQDERDKEQLLAPVLATLALCQIRTGNYELALETCITGYETSKKRNKGFYLPDFVHAKALCLVNMRQMDVAVPLLRQAYFGYALLRRNKDAADLLEFAKIECNVAIETYGVDTLKRPLPEPEFTYGDTDEFDTFGAMLDKFRKEANLSYANLCEGICARSTLENIIKGNQQGSVIVLDALMQRLGRDIDKYINTFPGKEDFYCKQKRDQANALITSQKYAEGEKLINELATTKMFEKNVGLQFIQLSRARMKEYHASNDPAHIEELLDVVRITNKKFDLRYVATTRLTYYEVRAVNMIAIHLCNNEKSRHRGLQLFEDLVTSMDTFYIDSTAKMRMYPTVLYNYTKYLGIAGRYEDALPVIDVGEMFCVAHGQFKALPGFATNKGCILFDMGEKRESLPYLVLAYYGCLFIENFKGVETVMKYVKTHFGITLD